MFKTARDFKNKFLLAIVSLTAASSANAAGLTKTEELLQKVFEEAHSLVGVVVAIAAMIVGFRCLFRGESIKDCWGVILGAGIISAAAEIGKWLS
ncbi:TPA: TrbC/VirB2 family protein [Serratia liquefaciens]|nr:TrbC/VirB2 family protein [Serratia liquefaciens]